MTPPTIARPSTPAAWTLALSALAVGAGLSCWLSAKQAEVNGPSQFLDLVWWCSAPYALLAGLAVSPWTTRTAWYVVAVALAGVSAGGVMLVSGAPYYQLGAIAIVLGLTCQLAAVGVTSLTTAVLWGLASRRAASRGPDGG